MSNEEEKNHDLHNIVGVCILIVALIFIWVFFRYIGAIHPIITE